MTPRPSQVTFSAVFAAWSFIKIIDPGSAGIWKQIPVELLPNGLGIVLSHWRGVPSDARVIVIACAH